MTLLIIQFSTVSCYFISLLDPNTFLRTLLPFLVGIKFHTHVMQQTKLWICMLYVCINIQGSDVGIDRL